MDREESRRRVKQNLFFFLNGDNYAKFKKEATVLTKENAQ